MENDVKTAFSAEIPLVNVHFAAFEIPRSTVKTAYPTRPAPAAKPSIVEAKPRETVISLSDLAADHKILTDTLIRCGAFELESGLSVTRLKKAHRRLVKSLHPDRNATASVERFMLVQEAYETLSQALPSYSENHAKAA